jgi:hypothetical protein
VDGDAPVPSEQPRGDYTVLVTPDGASYAYGYTRALRDLYLVTGVK